MSSSRLVLLDTKGFIYDVYDMGDGRVLKKEKPRLVQYWKHLWHHHSPMHVERNNALSKKLTGALPDLSILGNPEWRSGYSYTQEKVTVLEDYFASHSVEESTRAIDAYIECVFETWRQGFSDVIFNFTHNNGIRDDGSVILLDFNEVTLDKKEVALRIDIKRWLRADSYKRKLHEGPVKVYYAEAMEKAMTKENLDKYWKDNEQLLGKTK